MEYVIAALMIIVPVAFYFWYVFTGSDLCRYIFYGFIVLVIVGCLYFSVSQDGHGKDRYSAREIETFDGGYYRD